MDYAVLVQTEKEKTKDEMMQKLFDETMRGQGVQLKCMMQQEAVTEATKQLSAAKDELF